MQLQYGKGLAIALATVTSTLLLELPASAASFTFEQTGFDFGGTLSGSFEFNGVDPLIVGDGFIEGSELTAFTATFSSSSLIPGTTFGLGDLSNFVYDFGSDLFDVSDDISLEVLATIIGPPEIELLSFTLGDITSGQETTIANFSTFEEEIATGNFTITSPSTVIPEPGSSLIISFLLSAGLLSRGRLKKRSQS
ncbi:hypothetical protein [Synechococcus sp. PCC 7336]|uniref:hypothetical protein n=1 Tax=Synechococcus sp. PCC 7336 TaxID=195250 RepID=UPI0003464967|nr:hypothetical protein [Synechococcus sp. PCC 7336]